MTRFQRRRLAIGGGPARNNELWVALGFVVAGMVMPLAAIATLFLGRIGS
jgi:hypothetical protein